MNQAILGAFGLLGLFTLLAALAGKRKLSAGLTIVGWLSFVGGVAAIYADVFLSPAIWAAFAGAAAFGAVFAPASELAHRRVHGALGAMLIALVGGLMVTGAPESAQNTGHAVVLTVVWAAIFASFASAVAASLVPTNGKGVGPSAGLPVAGGLLGALIVGSSRMSLHELGYALPLQGADGPLRWVLPPVFGFEEGLVLNVSAFLPAWVFYGVIASSIVAMIGGLVARNETTRKVGLAAFAMSGAMAIVIAIGVVTTSTTTLPDAQPYKDYTRQALLSQQAQERFLSAADFSSTDVTGVVTQALGFDFGALLAAGLVALLAAFFIARRDEECDPTAARLLTRDLMVRAVAMGWLAWFVAALYRGTFVGAMGVGSPSEWVLHGLLLTATGLLILSWNASTRFHRFVGQLLPGLLAGAWLVYMGLSVAFGSAPGLGLSYF